MIQHWEDIELCSSSLILLLWKIKSEKQFNIEIFIQNLVLNIQSKVLINVQYLFKLPSILHFYIIVINVSNYTFSAIFTYSKLFVCNPKLVALL